MSVCSTTWVNRRDRGLGEWNTHLKKITNILVIKGPPASKVLNWCQNFEIRAQCCSFLVQQGSATCLWMRITLSRGEVEIGYIRDTVRINRNHESFAFVILFIVRCLRFYFTGHVHKVFLIVPQRVRKRFSPHSCLLINAGTWDGLSSVLGGTHKVVTACKRYFIEQRGFTCNFFGKEENAIY